MKGMEQKGFKPSIGIIGGLLLLTITAPLVCESSSYRKGRIAAQEDLRNGIYKSLTYGLPVPWNTDYARVLKRRYNIALTRVAGCIVTDALTEYVRGYDSVSEDALRRKFGRDVFDESASEAQKQWQKKRQEEFPVPPPSSLPPMKP